MSHRLARLFLSICALWLALLSTVSAASAILTPAFTGSWTPFQGGMRTTSPDATVTVQVDGGTWGTLTVNAAGFVSNRGTQTPADVQVNLDGSGQSYPPTPQIAIATNHVYNVVIRMASGTDGMYFLSATASGSPNPVVQASTSSSPAVIAPTQEPAITTSPAAAATSINQTSAVIGFTTTIITNGVTATLISSVTSAALPTSAPSSLPSSASLQTLGNPLLYPPNASVSLTNADPSLSNDASQTTSSSPNYSTVVGAVFGSLAAIAICFLCSFFYYRRRQRKRIPPSMAYMNYRSTTEQPPKYNFHKDRSAFDAELAAASRASAYGHGNRAGVGAGGGLLTVANAGRRLSVLDEKSAEGSMGGHSPSPFAPMTSNETMRTGERHGSLDSTIDAGIARTLSPPSSADPSTNVFPLNTMSARSERNSTAYDGVEEVHMPNPFDDHAIHSAGRRDQEFGFSHAV